MDDYQLSVQQVVSNMYTSDAKVEAFLREQWHRKTYELARSIFEADRKRPTIDNEAQITVLREHAKIVLSYARDRNIIL